MRNKPVKNLEIKVKGILIPEAWDENGRVVAVHIATSGEKNYELDCRTKKGKELLKHLQQELEVTGVLSHARNASAKMRVSDYQLLYNNNPGHLKKKVEKLWETKSL